MEYWRIASWGSGEHRLAACALRRSLAEKGAPASCRRQQASSLRSPDKMSMTTRPQPETNGFSAFQALPHSALRSQSSASRFRR